MERDELRRMCRKVRAMFSLKYSRNSECGTGFGMFSCSCIHPCVHHWNLDCASSRAFRVIRSRAPRSRCSPDFERLRASINQTITGGTRFGKPSYTDTVAGHSENGGDDIHLCTWMLGCLRQKQLNLTYH